MNGIYCGPAPLPAEIWARWNLDPILIGALLVGFMVLGRNHSGRLGVAILTLAFLSPLCALSSALFSARVVHHVLLVAVAAPLIARCLPVARSGSVAVPFALATLILWIWHLPAAYDAALSNQAVYWLMQVTLTVSAVWFWRAVFAARRPAIDAMLFILAGYMQMGLLGALLTFAPEQLYAVHALSPIDWGLSPLTDQQLGGLIMWVPAGIPYAIAAIAIARRGWAGLQDGRA